MQLKQCHKCTKEFPRDNFHNDKSRRDGKRDICKQCALSAKKKWVHDNPPDKQSVKKHNSEYYKSNREILLQRSRDRYPDYRARASVLGKLRYHKSASSKKLYSSAYRKNNKDKMAIYRKRHYRKYKPYYLLKFKKRRALKRLALVDGHDITEQLLVDKCKYYGGRCFYCGRSIIRTTNNSCPTQLNMDHFIPLFSGGKELLSNYVPSCKTCNCRKHTMNGHAFMRLLKKEANP